MLNVTIVPPIQIQNNDDDHSIDTVTDCLDTQDKKIWITVDGFN